MKHIIIFLFVIHTTISFAQKSTEFPVTIESLEKVITNNYTKKSIDSIFSQNISGDTTILKSYNPITKLMDIYTYRYTYYSKYKGQNIIIEFEVKNDSIPIDNINFIINDYYWYDSYSNNPNNKYSIDIIHLVKKELEQRGYIMGKTYSLGTWTFEFYTKENCSIKLGVNAAKPTVTIKAFR